MESLLACLHDLDTLPLLRLPPPSSYTAFAVFPLFLFTFLRRIPFVDPSAQTLCHICNSNSCVVIYLRRSSLNDLLLLFLCSCQTAPLFLANGFLLSTASRSGFFIYNNKKNAVRGDSVFMGREEDILTNRWGNRHFRQFVIQYTMLPK